MSKKANTIELSEEEDAIIYYEKVLGKNITIQKRAAVIYYASKGINTITEIHKKCGCTIAIPVYLIPQNSKRCSESQEGMNPAITSSKSKAELTSVNGKMTGNENKIINYGTDPAAFDSAVTNRHIIFLHRLSTDNAKNVVCDHSQFQDQCVCLKLSAGQTFDSHIGFDFTMKLFADCMIMI